MVEVEHVADQTLRGMFMSVLHDHCRSDELMVKCLVGSVVPAFCHIGWQIAKRTEAFRDFKVVVTVQYDAAAQPWDSRDHVDLVEGQPVFDLVLVFVNDEFQIAEAMRDDFFGDPAVILFNKDDR